MTNWRPQLYKRQATIKGIDSTIVANAIAAAQVTLAVNPRLPPVFTLRHLSHLASVDYGLLRAIVSRSHLEPYRVFRISKRPAYSGERRYRVIAVPTPGLLQVQRWITHHILSEIRPHTASVAYSRGDTVLAASAPHCEQRWLIKIDVRNFFESINEISVYRVFRSLGYQALISFEMARLCTRLTEQKGPTDWESSSSQLHTIRRTISSYSQHRMGHLPQGAPTSPMLANLAVREFDGLVSLIADSHDMIYTRYADDLTLSTAAPDFDRERCPRVIGEIYAAMGSVGLSPGSRKVVLGLLVDGPKPRLPFKAKMRQHIYYLTRADVGPAKHAKARRFASIAGFKHHLQGLISFASQIEPEYAQDCRRRLSKVTWPV
jgi:RNA-directed DNA polymerase